MSLIFCKWIDLRSQEHSTRFNNYELIIYLTYEMFCKKHRAKFKVIGNHHFILLREKKKHSGNAFCFCFVLLGFTSKRLRSYVDLFSFQLLLVEKDSFAPPYIISGTNGNLSRTTYTGQQINIFRKHCKTNYFKETLYMIFFTVFFNASIYTLLRATSRY